ncbi:unnamed protein product [Boreogadus saida]
MLPAAGCREAPLVRGTIARQQAAGMEVKDTSPPVPVHSEMICSAMLFPLVSLFLMFIGFVLINVGHIRPHHLGKAQCATGS